VRVVALVLTLLVVKVMKVIACGCCVASVDVVASYPCPCPQ